MIQDNTTIKKSMGFENSTCKKERRKRSVLQWLQKIKWHHHTWCVSIAESGWLPGSFEWDEVVFKHGYDSRLPSDSNESWGQGQNSFYLRLRFIRVQCDAVWTDKCSCYVSEINGYRICWVKIEVNAGICGWCVSLKTLMTIWKI